MKKILTSFLIFLLLAGVAFANRIIAKDSTPRGIYIVGPDVSPDSTDLTLLYYSPDAGSTLVIRDTLDWVFFPLDGIATDVTDEIVYLVRTGPADDGMWVSNDGGYTWIHHSGYPQSIPYSGNIAGEILMGIGVFSTDYGVSAFAGEGRGLHLTSSIVTFGGGTEPGESYFFEANGYIWRGWNYADTFAIMDSIQPLYITAGSLPGELWGYHPLNDSLYYSANHGSTFTELTPAPILPDGEYYNEWGFIRGNLSGFLFVAKSDYNWHEFEGIRGGNLTICYTTNFADTFICINHDATGVSIEVVLDITESKLKPIENTINAYPNPFNSSCAISAPEGAKVEIFDLRGRLVTPSSDAARHLLPMGEGNNPLPLGEGGSTVSSRVRGFIWQPSESISSGIYLIRATTKDGLTETKRIIYLR